MPYNLQNEPSGLGVLISFFGFVKGDEIYDLNEKLLLNKSFSEWRYQIWDFSNIESSEISLDQVKKFAIQDSVAAQKAPNQRVAIIPPRYRRSHLDRVFHIYEEIWGGYESKSFSDIDSAREWAENGSK